MSVSSLFFSQPFSLSLSLSLSLSPCFYIRSNYNCTSIRLANDRTLFSSSFPSPASSFPLASHLKASPSPEHSIDFCFPLQNNLSLSLSLSLNFSFILKSPSIWKHWPTSSSSMDWDECYADDEGHLIMKMSSIFFANSLSFCFYFSSQTPMPIIVNVMGPWSLCVNVNADPGQRLCLARP